MKRLAIALLFLPITAHAWTRASDQRIAQKGAALAPPDLRMLLQKFESEYTHGIERAQAEEGTESHHYFVLSRNGKLRERIERETRAAIVAVRKGDPMPVVIDRLGVLAHLVADANNPFHTSDADVRLGPAHDDFEQYFERRMARFPTVFYGLDEDFQLAPYLDRTLARSSKLYPLMTEEYLRGDTLHTSADFDDRSTAFGVASVCYSHAVTDLVNLYYYIWREAGGDVRSAASLRGSNLLLNASN
jgi:hypothetical protein